jgi:hypothetical protein
VYVSRTSSGSRRRSIARRPPATRCSPCSSTTTPIGRRRGVYRSEQSPGAQQVGYCSIRNPSVAAGQQVGAGVSFVPVLSNTPATLTFTAIASSHVGSGPTVTPGTLTPYGCEVTVTAASTGAVVWTGKDTTVGA